MGEPAAYSVRRYLAAKRTVDDRALNRRVLNRLEHEVADADPLRVLEVGAGIGTMIERLLAWELFPAEVGYTAVDIDPETVAAARERLPERCARRGFAVDERDGEVTLQAGGCRIAVELRTADAFDVVEDTDREWDLLIAHAFLDLTDTAAAVGALAPALAPGGLAYFPITFDGGTVFQPPVDRALDDRIERRYHAHMDAPGADGEPAGNSRAGRELFGAVRDRGGRVLAAGSSDWVVYPGSDGYPADEAYFLHHIVETVRRTLADDPDLDGDRFDEWIATRRREIEDGRLVYVAHQLDLLARFP